MKDKFAEFEQPLDLDSMGKCREKEIFREQRPGPATSLNREPFPECVCIPLSSEDVDCKSPAVLPS